MRLLILSDKIHQSFIPRSVAQKKLINTVEFSPSEDCSTEIFTEI